VTSFITHLIAGSVGAIIGILVGGMCSAAKRADETAMTELGFDPEKRS
jgi:hypothetical protein